MLVVMATAGGAFADGKVTGKVSDLSDQPVKDASVFISGPNGLEASVTTDPTGRYYAQVKPGPHTIIFAFGNKRVTATVNVVDDQIVTQNEVLEMGGEIIEVVELPKPLQYPKLQGDPLAIPTYSDEAVETDVWVKAWVLLDVDDRGIPQRVKFLVRPGHGLDVIAVKHAFNLRFTPARNPHGVPVQSYIVWALEWPSHSWMQNGEHPMGRLPDFGLSSVQTSQGLLAGSYPPCGKGGPGGPMSFGFALNGQRDCTVPDMAHGDASEPWIHRDATNPAPSVSVAATIDPRKLRDEINHKKRTLRLAAVGVSALAAAAFTTTIYAWVKLNNAQTQLDEDTSGQHSTVLPPSLIKHDQNEVDHWEAFAFPMAAATVLTGVATAYIWHKALTTITVTPTSEGAAVSLSGQF